MIEKLDILDTRYRVIIEKINEIIDTVNGTYLPATLEVTESEPYCSQAEEALKQVAQLEHTFDNHTHQITDNTHVHTLSGPIITMVDDRD